MICARWRFTTKSHLSFHTLVCSDWHMDIENTTICTYPLCWIIKAATETTTASNSDSDSDSDRSPTTHFSISSFYIDDFSLPPTRPSRFLSRVYYICAHIVWTLKSFMYRIWRNIKARAHHMHTHEHIRMHMIRVWKRSSLCASFGSLG